MLVPDFRYYVVKKSVLTLDVASGMTLDTYSDITKDMKLDLIWNPISVKLLELKMTSVSC